MGGFVAAISAGTAVAAAATFDDSFALSDVEIPGVLSAPKFDASLVTLTGAVASMLGVENDAATPVSGSAFTNVDFAVESADLGLGSSPDFTVSGSTGLVALGVGASAPFPVAAPETLSGTETPLVPEDHVVRRQRVRR